MTATSKKQKNKGFSLVEVIVVLVILAILASILIPSLIGYIDRAKEKSMIAETRGIYMAAQTTISEQYALNPNYSKSLTMNAGSTGLKRGRVSNYAISRAQRYDNYNQVQNTDMGEVEFLIAKQVLAYLESEKSSSGKVYSFKSNSSNPLNQPSSKYTQKEPGIIVGFDENGKIDIVEFGYGNTIVAMGRDQNIEVRHNSKFTASIDNTKK